MKTHLPKLYAVLSLCLLLAGCDLQVQAGGPDAGEPDASSGEKADAGPNGAPGAGAINAGAHHTCGITAGGKTWCWGRNQYGEQGTDGPYSPVPVQARIENLVEVSAGRQSSCGRKTDGTVWCFGRILGEDQDTLMSPPAEVTAVGIDVEQLAVAGSSLVVRKADGTVWGWGAGTLTQLVTEPASELAVGDGLCWVRATDSAAFCGYGSTASGIIGDGTTDGSGSGQVLVPGPVEGLTAGGGFACAIVTGGEVWCWGRNHTGQTGTETSQQDCEWSGAGATPCNPLPVKVEGLPGPASALAAGYNFTLALLADGTVWGWGANDYFQLGGPNARTCTSVLGTSACSPVPMKVPVEPLSQLEAGDDHACGCGQDGKAWCWGDSGSGKLGASSLPNAARPQPPVNPDGFRCW